MHSEPIETCPLCSQPKPKPQQPTLAIPVFHIQYHAPAGIFYQPLAAGTPEAALSYARDFACSRTFKPEDFEPDDNAFRVQQIIVMDENSTVEHALWTDPDSFAQLNADEILEQLEALIEAADELSDANDALRSQIGEVIDCGQQAAIALKTIRREGGAQ